MLGKKILLAGAIVLLTVAGFSLGHAVNAQETAVTAGTNAGQAADPLVTKSYLDGEAAKLQNKLDSLKMQADFLKTEVGNLKLEIDKLKAARAGS